MDDPDPMILMVFFVIHGINFIEIACINVESRMISSRYGNFLDEWTDWKRGSCLEISILHYNCLGLYLNAQELPCYRIALPTCSDILMIPWRFGIK